MYERHCPRCGATFRCTGLRGDGSKCPGLEKDECLCPECWSKMTGFPSSRLSCRLREE